MPQFEADEERPVQPSGQPALLTGIIVYVMTVGASVIAIAFGRDVTRNALLFALFVPIAVSAVVFALSWSAFWIGTVTGTPLVSFTYAYAQAKRNWRWGAGAILTLSALIALIVLVLGN